MLPTHLESVSFPTATETNHSIKGVVFCFLAPGQMDIFSSYIYGLLLFYWCFLTCKELTGINRLKRKKRPQVIVRSLIDKTGQLISGLSRKGGTAGTKWNHLLGIPMQYPDSLSEVDSLIHFGGSVESSSNVDLSDSVFSVDSASVSPGSSLFNSSWL